MSGKDVTENRSIIELSPSIGFDHRDNIGKKFSDRFSKPVLRHLHCLTLSLRRRQSKPSIYTGDFVTRPAAMQAILY